VQQDGVESLQSDRELLKKKLSLFVIGRDRSDFVVHIFKNCIANLLLLLLLLLAITDKNMRDNCNLDIKSSNEEKQSDM